MICGQPYRHEVCCAPASRLYAFNRLVPTRRPQTEIRVIPCTLDGTPVRPVRPHTRLLAGGPHAPLFAVFPPLAAHAEAAGPLSQGAARTPERALLTRHVSLLSLFRPGRASARPRAPSGPPSGLNRRLQPSSSSSPGPFPRTYPPRSTAPTCPASGCAAGAARGRRRSLRFPYSHTFTKCRRFHDPFLKPPVVSGEHAAPSKRTTYRPGSVISAGGLRRRRHGRDTPRTPRALAPARERSSSGSSRRGDSSDHPPPRELRGRLLLLRGSARGPPRPVRRSPRASPAASAAAGAASRHPAALPPALCAPRLVILRRPAPALLLPPSHRRPPALRAARQLPLTVAVANHPQPAAAAAAAGPLRRRDARQPQPPAVPAPLAHADADAPKRRRAPARRRRLAPGQRRATVAPVPAGHRAARQGGGALHCAPRSPHSCKDQGGAVRSPALSLLRGSAPDGAVLLPAVSARLQPYSRPPRILRPRAHLRPRVALHPLQRHNAGGAVRRQGGPAGLAAAETAWQRQVCQHHRRRVDRPHLQPALLHAPDDAQPPETRHRGVGAQRVLRLTAEAVNGAARAGAGDSLQPRPAGLFSVPDPVRDPSSGASRMC